MTSDQEKTIRDVVRANVEIINRLYLQSQALMAQLPEDKTIGAKTAKGYITLPDGERLWYDKAAEKKHAAGKRKLAIVEESKCRSKLEATT